MHIAEIIFVAVFGTIGVLGFITFLIDDGGYHHPIDMEDDDF